MNSNKPVKVSVNNLIVGLYIDLDIGWSEHPFTFAKFLIKDEKTLKTIQSLAIDHVLVFPSKSKVKIPEKKPAVEKIVQEEKVVQEEKIEEITPDNDVEQDGVEKDIQSSKEKISAIKKNYEQTAEQIKQMTVDLKDRPVNAVHNIDKLAMKLSSIFDNNTKMITQMISLGNEEHSEHHHITNVTMLSLMVGKAEGMSASELTLLSAAALLHDVGKIKIPLSIRYKKSKLTESENKILQQHTYLGRQFIELVKNMHPEILNTIEQHHEYMDGSGYPKGLKADQLSKIVRIVTITNLYDDLCNATDIKAAMTPKMALATLYKTYDGKLDKSLVERLIAVLGVYPPGTVVKLTNDCIGLVISVDTESFMTPNILVYDPAVPKKEAAIICLTDFPGITIKEALSLDQVPLGIHHYLGLKERLGYLMDSGQN